MIPTVAQVYAAARAVLGDTQTAAGEVFTDDILAPHFATAYSELFRNLQSGQSPRVVRQNYYLVPALTGYIAPSTAGISNMGELVGIEERGGVTSWAISNVVPGAAICTVTSAATTLASGQQAIVSGVLGVTEDVNDVWTVTVNSTVSTRLNGCIATGTYTSGGTLSTSGEAFLMMSPEKDFEWTDQSPTSAFLFYVWNQDMIRVPPCATARQIRITYTLSGSAPTATTASTGVDDSLDFFKYRIAGLAGPSKGMLTRAQQYNYIAVGPMWESNAQPGGILQQLAITGVRNLQRLPPQQRRSPPFGQNWRRGRWNSW